MASTSASTSSRWTTFCTTAKWRSSTRRKRTRVSTPISPSEQITAGEDEWNRLTLDRSWFGVALARDSAKQVGLKPEGRERQGKEAPDEALPQTRGPVRADGEFGSDFG